MGVFRNFPYSNFHEMNMDEILKILKTMQEEWNATKTEWASYKDFIDNYFANLDVSQEVLSALRVLASTGELNRIIDPTIATETASWLAEHITPTTPVVDSSLSIPGAAADAKATGDAVKVLERAILGNIESFANINGQYVTRTGELATNASLRVSDFILIPESAIKIRVANKVTVNDNVYHIVPCVVFYDSNREVIKYSTNSTDDVVDENIPYGARYVRFNQSMNSVDYHYAYFIDFSLTNANGYCDHFESVFTSQRVIRTGIKLNANTTYIIKYNSNITARINNYNSNDTAIGRYVQPWKKFCVLRNGNTAGELYVYNSGGGLDTVNIDVYLFGSIKEKCTHVPDIYTVDVNNPNNGDYSSLTQCLLDLKNNNNEKIIFINGGVYDIHQEYVDANVPVYTGDDPSTDFWNYNVFVPNNTHIIGKGIVKLRWEPNADQITGNQSKTVSPLNVMGNVTIENVEIYCKNGRYCIHDDTLGKPEFEGSTRIYKNVKCYKYTNDTNYGFRPVVGMGLDARCSYIFEDCEFYNYDNERAFYAHTRAIASGRRDSANILIKNSILDSGTYQMTVKFGNTTGGSGLEIKTKIESSYISDKIYLINESGDTPISNRFNLTMINCNDTQIEITDPDNPFVPKIYNSL